MVVLRHFELNDIKSSKFWEIRIDSLVVTVRYGRLGTNGQTVSKSFTDTASASMHGAKLVTEKIGKGYVERKMDKACADTKIAAAGATSEAVRPTSSMVTVARPAKSHPKRGSTAVTHRGAMSEQLEPFLGKDDAANRLLAKDPNASGSMLERLSHSSDKATRQSVVLHPNSPKEVLLHLAPQFPADFIRNPAFDWLLVEDPDLLFRLSPGVLKNILKQPECPASFIDWAAKHGSDQLQLAVVMNAATPIQIVQRLARKGGPLAEAAAGRLQVNESGGTADGAGNLDATFDAALRDSLAVMRSDDAVAAWKRGSIGAGQWCSMSLDGRLRVLGFSLSAVLPKIISYHAARLAQDRSPRIREFVANDPGTPKEVVARLTADVDAAVKDAAEKRLAGVAPDMAAAATPQDWEAVLAKGNAQSRLELAAHPLAPKGVLERVSMKANPAVWKALSYNPACPEGLRQSAWDIVAAAAGPKILEGMVLDPAAPAGLRMRASERIWWNEFDAFVQSARGEVRKRIHRSYGDQKHIFAPPSAERIRELHDAFCSAMVNDPSTSLLADLLGVKETVVTALAPALVPEGCRSALLPIRLLALSHRDAAPAELAQTSKAVEWQVRLAIARNTNTPRANLKLLSSDTDHRVAAQARDTLRDQQRRKQGQDDRILQPLPAIDLSPVISELTRRLGATKDRCSGYPSLLMPWHLVGTLWWGILPFGVRLGTTSFDNPFHVRVPALSEQLLERLSRHADPEVRCLAARNLGAPVALLHELAGDSSAEVRYSVGMNPSTPDALQVELAKAMAKSGIPCPHEMPHGEGNPIEQDPGIAPGFLRTLARRSGGYAGCKWVALNPSLPEESLLSPSFTRDQKGLVARNPSLPQKLILKWAMDPESREDVAINPSLPQALLNAWLTEAVRDQRLRAGLARNPAIPVASMREFVSDADEFVRRNLAHNPALPADLIQALAADKSLNVRLALVSNPSTPWNTLLELMGDKSKTVSHRVSFTGLYERQLHHELRSAVDSATPVERLQELSSRGPWIVRMAAVQNPALARKDPTAAGRALEAEIIHALDPVNTVFSTEEPSTKDLASALNALGLIPYPSGADAAALAATSTDWLRRSAVALSDEVQPWVLRRLLDDEVDLVRRLATQRLQRLTSVAGTSGDRGA